MKVYVVSLDTLKTITAESEKDAIIEAKQTFIECLQRGEGEFTIVEEWDET